MRFDWGKSQSSLKEAIIIVAKEALKENSRDNTNEWVQSSALHDADST